MKRICIVNVKGGDGKSTICNTLPRALYHFHNKTSLVGDFDNQLNCTESYIDLDDIDENHTTYNALNDGFTPKPIYINDGISLIPGESRLTELDQQDFRLLTRARKVLRSEDGFDYAFYDTPGQEGNRVAAVLNASDALIIPIKLTKFSMRALDLTVSIIQDVIEGPNPQLKVLGVVPMAVNSPINGVPTIEKELGFYEEVKEAFGDLLLPMIANRPAIYAKTSEMKIGVTELPENEGKRKAVAEVKALADEVFKRIEAL